MSEDVAQYGISTLQDMVRDLQGRVSMLEISAPEQWSRELLNVLGK